jgi:hypothetical protein
VSWQDIFLPSSFFGNVSYAYALLIFSELTQCAPGVSGLLNVEAQKSTTVELRTRGQHGRFNWDVSLYSQLTYH